MMSKHVKTMREIAKVIGSDYPGFEERLLRAAAELEQDISQLSEKLTFMVEMQRLDFNIDLDDQGDFINESTNAMFVGWMAKVNKKG